MWLSSCGSLAAKSYAVASTQFASEWGHIHHFWLRWALFERTSAVCRVPIETASTAAHPLGALMGGGVRNK